MCHPMFASHYCIVAGALLSRLMLAESAIAQHRQQLVALKQKHESLTDVVGEVVEVLEAANLDAFSSMQEELEDMGHRVNQG